jgi:hypothetical protein
MTPRPPSPGPGRSARSLVLHLAGGALAGTVLTVVLLLAIEVVGAAERPGAPLPERLGVALARLDPGVLPPMAAFGGAAGLAAWAVAYRRPPR